MAKLNPEISQVLQALDDADIPPLETLTATQAREAFQALRALRAPAAAPTPVGSVDDALIPTADGKQLPVRVYHPESERGDLPALVWMHGGGWVLGDLDTADTVCRDLCKHADCVVISVDYRLAPEALFPAAYDDCLLATQWTFDNATQLGINMAQIAVGGDSAGGNLAACVAITARDQQLPLAAQLLIYPVIEDNFDTNSYRDKAQGYFLTTPMMQWFWDQYVPESAQRNDIRVNPIKAPLAGLPPALVLTVEHDPLRDEGISYAKALHSANVAAEEIYVDDSIHGYFSMDIDCAAASRKEVALQLHGMLRPQ